MAVVQVNGVLSSAANCCCQNVLLNLRPAESGRLNDSAQNPFPSPAVHANEAPVAMLKLTAPGTIASTLESAGGVVV